MLFIPNMRIGSIYIQVVVVYLHMTFLIEILDGTRSKGGCYSFRSRILKRHTSSLIYISSVLISIRSRQHQVIKDLIIKLVCHYPILVLTRVTSFVRCQEASMSSSQRRIRCQLIRVLDDSSIRISWDERRQNIGLQTMNGLLLIIITSILVSGLVEIEIDRVCQTVRQLCIQFSTERDVLIVVLINIKDTVLVEETSTGKIIHLVISTIYRHIMFLLWSCLTIKVIIPIEVSIIVILAIVTDYRPRSIRILRLVITSVIKHLQIFISIICHQLTLISLIKLIDDTYMVITRMDKVGRSRILLPTYTTIISNSSLASRVLTTLGRNQNDTRRSLGSINGRS